MTIHPNAHARRAPTISPAPRSRLTSLDGLRGLAALIVVFHHLSLTNPTVSAVILGDVRVPPALWSPAWWITSTPAQLFVAGHEAVLVFFVLSGFVVALPVLGRADFNWIGYYVQRVLRLYLPVAASMLLALVWIVTSAQSEKNAVSSWVASSSVSSVSLKEFLGNLDLLRSGFSLNNPVWSLRWELIFSLALPIFVVIGMMVRRYWAIAMVLCVVASGVGVFYGDSTMEYLPVFLLGTILAARRVELQEWAAAISSRTAANVLGLLVSALAFLALTGHWMLWAVWGGSDWVALADVLRAVGAVALVAVALVWRPAVRVLSTPVFRWLGRVSFSLYLVHVPAIIALTFIIPRGNGPEVMLLALTISLCLAQLFYWGIERPSQRFARYVGAAAGRAPAHWFARSTTR